MRITRDSSDFSPGERRSSKTNLEQKPFEELATYILEPLSYQPPQARPLPSYPLNPSAHYDIHVDMDFREGVFRLELFRLRPGSNTRIDTTRTISKPFCRTMDETSFASELQTLFKDVDRKFNASLSS